MTALYYLFLTVLQFLILFGLIILTKYIFQRILKNHPYYEKFFFFFNIYSSIIWTVFVIIKLFSSINDNYIIVGSVVLIIVVLIWEFLKNLFFGLIIRLQYGFLVNQKIHHNKSSITILNYYTTYIEARSDNGKRLSLKYSTLFSSSFSVLKGELFNIEQSIFLESQNHHILFDKYKSVIINHPLYIHNDNALFNLKIDDNNNYWLNVHFNVLSRKHVLIMNDFISHLNN